jgi:hypothetical protein
VTDITGNPPVESNCISTRICGNEIEVVCIYCESGVDTEIGDRIADFTVFNVWAMDGILAELIERWPHYRQGVGQAVDEDAEENLNRKRPLAPWPVPRARLTNIWFRVRVDRVA